ncbi:MAG: MBL fold metallo-hydrolase [Euryarchaeota archaeon]|nr:MBL fold metallo-hydrolase [Euryarchaeota archaeon]MDP6363759.1 MBL fold metallo-hydrolase [Candidatus Poseidoniia archaeon]MDP6658341.1 MBL fold metallo-hydrolase [Candidatus Poseidoniia archaeon]MDP6846462.1 MBL fold metallo-hydrolase [Candidatus Poseidoniia archaeon]MDP7006974.1 MBL fold metallo-hydrolase [Candidatus Poseidoniia archaeon]
MELHRHSEHLFWFDLQPNGVPGFITIYIWLDEKNAIIETGPACALERLMEGIAATGLTPEDVDWVLPTHIHLDHFGAGGHLLRELPNARALVHPKAQKHVIDPQRLWEGSRVFLGEIAELYGEPLPVPRDSVAAVEDGDVVDLGATQLRALHTPGHAPHHVAWVADREVFVGDALGLWYPELDCAFPVTPPRYDHALALKSLDALAALDAEWLHYTHFGPRPAAGGAAIAQVRDEFETWMALVADGVSAGEDAVATTARLLAARPRLAQTELAMGPHQTGTHLGSVRGMRGWFDAQS